MNGERVRIRFYFLEAAASGMTWVEAEFTSQENFDWQWKQQMKKVNVNGG
ncbi:hypothetical protein LCGC14_2316920, partial [marine sediment metagenome]